MPAHSNGPGTGFVGLNQMLAANQGTVDADTKQLTAGVDAQGNKARDLDNQVASNAYAANLAGGPYDSSKDGTYQRAVSANTAAATAANALGSDPAGALAAKNPAIGGNVGYGAGAQNFDNALFGASQGAQGAFKSAKAQYGGLSDYLDNSVKDASVNGNMDWYSNQPQPVHTTTAATPPAADPDSEGNVLDQHTSRRNDGTGGPTDTSGNSNKGTGGTPTTWGYDDNTGTYGFGGKGKAPGGANPLTSKNKNSSWGY